MDHDPLVIARQVLHAVAEHLLAGPQHRQTGEITLAVTATGFRTTHAPAPGLTALEVHGDQVVAQPGGTGVPIGGSIRAMAAALGVEPGAPEGVYADHGPLGVDDPLPGGLTAAIGTILAAFTDGDAALRQLDGSQEPILWPEHFDVGISAGEVNYGLSPGDAGHDEPYAYVGPWTPRTGDFWNAPFGAARPAAELGGVPGMLAFFTEGRRRAAHG